MKDKKKYSALLGGLAVAGMAIVAISAMAYASTAPSVSCTGAVSGDQITWTATSTGGNAPYAYLWSGANIASGTTSTPVTVTYGANGAYTADIQVTDASSSVATSSCSAAVNSYQTTTTGTLELYTMVNNGVGGTAVPSDFTVSVSGANANPGSSTGSASGTAVTVTANTAYSIGVSSLANYTASMGGNCIGPVAAGATASCTVTETYGAPITTPPVPPTPPLPRVNPPTLSIGPDGQFLSRGMTVTSVASGSFQGTVWGITYTVNWSGSLFPEFYFREGNGGSMTTDPVTQLQVGDEVGVSGRIDSSATPLVVDANVVRDYSIMAFRPGRREGQSSSPFYNGVGNGGENGNGSGLGNVGNGGENGNGSSLGTEGSISTSNASSVSSLQAQLDSLLSQFRSLETIFNNGQHGNGNGNGNGHGNGKGSDN